jgi:uncharacterized protein YdhG (YjbR/CyaY superfamily)
LFPHRLTMPKSPVDVYLAKQPKAARTALRRVRAAIRRALPGAEETISYQIPAYKLHGRVAIYFAGWKEHYSVYPANDRLVKAFGRALARYELSKGTIRFTLAEPVPVRLIERIAKFLGGPTAPRRRSPGARFRRIALGMKDAVEGSHMGHPDFRAAGRIFASLYDEERSGMVKLTPDQQRQLIEEQPAVFAPQPGAWGRQGYTKVHLTAADEDTLGEAITLAWRNVTSIRRRSRR